MGTFQQNIIWVLCAIVLLSGCKSEFEKIRTSGNSVRLYEAGMRYYDEGEFLKAQTLFEQIISAYKGRKEAEDLYFKYAYTYYELEQYILSAYYFNNFTTTFARSPKREEAMYMAAYSSYLLSPSFRLDQKYTREAIEAFQKFVNTYPNSEKVSRCNTLIDELREKLERKAIARADLYYDMARFEAAVQSYNIVLQDYPETDEAEKIRYKMTKAEFEYAEKSVYAKRKKRYQETVELAQQFLRRYPNSEYAEDVIKFQKISEQQIKTIIDG